MSDMYVNRTCVRKIILIYSTKIVFNMKNRSMYYQEISAHDEDYDDC